MPKLVQMKLKKALVVLMAILVLNLAMQQERLELTIRSTSTHTVPKFRPGFQNFLTSKLGLTGVYSWPGFTEHSAHKPPYGYVGCVYPHFGGSPYEPKGYW